MKIAMRFLKYPLTMLLNGAKKDTDKYEEDREVCESNNVYIDLAKHCIGLDRKKPYIRHGKKFYCPYRNFFATGKDYENWEAMKQDGYADRDKEKNQHGGYTYWLTRIGLDWLGEQLGICIHDEAD